AYCDGRHHLF
ncbi:hypothetical protein VCHC55B2_3523B, partial [Vibrio cholerae HC-55B2]